MATSLSSTNILLQKIKNFAILSRLLVFFIQAVSNITIPDHDTSVFNPPRESDNHLMDRIVFLLFGGFRRWDAIYFTHIAQYWYTYENCLAFFPLYPLVINLTSKTILYPLHFVLSGHNVILVSSIVVNLFFFIQTAKAVFRLGCLVLKNDLIAYKASLLFCINPASIFMTAPYSEIFYMYLTVHGLLQFAENAILKSCFFIGVSSAARSNGLLNSFYLLYRYFKSCMNSFNNLFRMKDDLPVMSLVWIFSLRVIFGCIPFVLSFLPFLMYQYYCYSLYCFTNTVGGDIPEHLVEYGRSENLKLIGDLTSEWCKDTVPVAYSYIQKHRWNQGFLNYWEVKQIPNFILAAPVTAIVIFMALNFYRNNKYVCQTLGLDEEGAMKKDETQKHKEFRLTGPVLLPFVVHAIVLTVFGVFFIHVQVLTRLLFSSVPVLYWYTAYLVTPHAPVQPQQNRYDIFKPSTALPVETKENLDSYVHNLLTQQIMCFKEQNIQTKVILSYFICYFVVGTVLFSNFLPWT